MRTASLMLALLVAAAMAGCLGGSDNNDEQPTEDGNPSDGANTTSPDRGTRGPTGPGQRGAVDAYLEVSASNGTSPLNVTLTFGVNSTSPGSQGQGQGTGTGQGTGQGQGTNGTGQGTNGTGQGNATSNPGTTPPGRSAQGSADLTWTLEVHFTASASNDTGNQTGNSTGNATGNQTGNATGNQTGTSTATGTGSANATGTNQTNGTQTGSPADNSTTGADGNATANRTLFMSWNGTGEDLPGNETVWLNETGSYEVTFTVYSDNETAAVRTQSVAVTALPPGSPLGNETMVFEGSFLASEPLLLCIASEDHEWVLNATFENRSASVSHVNLTAEGSGLSDLELFLLDANGTELASGPEIHLEGPLEAGNYTVRVESCVAANASYTVTAIANYAVPA